MEQSASDAANVGAMVVRTTEDTPIGDGDPICKLAHVEVAIEAVTAGAKVIGRVMVLALQIENAYCKHRTTVTGRKAFAQLLCSRWEHNLPGRGARLLRGSPSSPVEMGEEPARIRESITSLTTSGGGTVAKKYRAPSESCGIPTVNTAT
jgi:hypothetical protein